MNPRKETAGTAALFLVSANEAQPPNAPFLGQVEELYSLGIDQAIAMEKILLAAVACLNSCILDIYKSAPLVAPVPSTFFASAAQTFASCMEMHMSWLALMGSHGRSRAKSVATNQAQTTAEGLAHHMDIAIGNQHTVPARAIALSPKTQTVPASTAARSPKAQAKTTADVQQYAMDIAIGSRKHA